MHGGGADGDLEDTATGLELLGDLAGSGPVGPESRELTDAEWLARAVVSPVSVARVVYLMARLAEYDATLGPEDVRSLFERSLTRPWAKPPEPLASRVAVLFVTPPEPVSHVYVWTPTSLILLDCRHNLVLLSAA